MQTTIPELEGLCREKEKRSMNSGGNADSFVSVAEHLAIHYRNYLNTPMAICFTAPDGNIVDANRAFLDLYGYTLEEVKGKNPRILKSGRQAPAAYKALWEAITDGNKGFWSGELINRKRNGEEVYVLLTISSVFRPDGSLIGYIASTMDIAERKRMELELEARNRELEQLSRFKSDMVAITSHDLKSPLNAMISYAELVREGLDSMPREKTDNYLLKISEYGRQLTKFIGELLDLTKLEAGKFQLVTNRVRLDTVLKGCIEINQAHSISKGVKIHYCRGGEKRTAVADVLRMTQVFNNVLSNAVKLSPEGGDITVRYNDNGNAVKITIEDQGPGIPEEDLETIFEQYYQVMKAGHISKRAFGSGIGLSVVRSIVALHHGTVKAENLAGKGCRFTIEMPLKTLTSMRGLAVLVIDPQGTIPDYIVNLARSLGADCFTAKDSGEATRIIDFENPDVVFLSEAAISGNIVTALKGVIKENRIYFIKIGDEELEADERFFRTLSLPVIDIEVKSALTEILNRELECYCGA